jgi:hypothetical protein
VVLLALAVLGGAPAAATAGVQRFAAPDGTGDCSPSSPCDIVTAINNAASGDEVILDSGRYGSDLAPLTTALHSTQTDLSVHGTDGEPRPRIFTNAQYGLDLGGAGDTARHLEIQQSASNVVNQHALVIQDGQATDVVVRNATAGGRACTLLGSSVLTNSVCEATAQDGRGVFPYRDSVGPLANSSIIRNATIVASYGMSGTGVYAQGGATPGIDENLTVTNSIIIAYTGTLAYAQAGTGAASITIDHSNFGFQSTGGPGFTGQIIKGEGNQQLTKAPAFIDPGDYHEAAGSITIDAGATNALNGPTDFDGDPRALGLGGTDIGADEFIPAPTAVTGDPGATTTTTAVINGMVNPNTIATTYHFEFGPTTAYGVSTPDRNAGSGTTLDPVSEQLSGLAPATTYHYRLVAASTGGTTIGNDRTLTTTSATGPGGTGGGGGGAPTIASLVLKPRRFVAGRGTRVTVNVDEGGTLRFTIQRRLPGRKVGRRCVKPTRRNRAARRCSRYVSRGGFSKPSKAGTNRYRFSGRLKGKKLPPGAYRMRAVAVDTEGHRSAPKFAAFRIRRR